MDLLEARQTERVKIRTALRRTRQPTETQDSSNRSVTGPGSCLAGGCHVHEAQAVVLAQLEHLGLELRARDVRVDVCNAMAHGSDGVVNGCHRPAVFG